jgi:PAS domain S-box-containing protein
MMILQGGAGLFVSSEKVTRDEWRRYVEYRKINTFFPGIRGIGVSKIIRPSDMARHVREIRLEGYTDYKVWPTEKRDIYTAIIYLEPLDALNRRAIGYDMFSEPVRRAAMERARDTGMVSISGRVRLVQETEKDIQHGFLMYLPIYMKGMPVGTLEERIKAIDSYVYAPFRMNDLMQGIFSDPIHEIDFKIYDGTEISESGLMYDSQNSPGESEDKLCPVFSRRMTIDLYGHHWTMIFKSRPLFEASIDRYTAPGILALGIILSLLILLIMKQQEGLRAKAAALAQRMTISLRESEEKYRFLSDNLPVGVSLIGPNMEVLANNATQRRWFPGGDYTQPPTCYTVFRIPPGTQPCESCPVVMAFKDGQIHKAERESETSQGMRTLYITAIPLVDQYGKVQSVHETVEDITERKRAMKVIQESKAKLNAALESMTDAVFISDTEGRFIEFNEAFATFHKFRNKEECVKKFDEYPAFLDVFMPDGTLAQIEQWAVPRALRGEKTTNAEYTLLRKDTGEKWVGSYSFAPIRDKEGAIIGSVVVGRDITERKQAEEEIRKLNAGLEQRVNERTRELKEARNLARSSHDRIKAILTATADGLVVTDHEARIVLMNSSAETLLGLKAPEIMGLPFYVSVEEQTLKERLRVAMMDRMPGYQFDFEMPADAEGRRRTLRAKTAKIATESTSEDNMVIVISDVTMEREVDRMKTEFLSTAAHELRTPLTSIQGFSEILMTRENLEPERARKYLTYINAQAVSLGKIVNDLLDISRIESGKGFNLNKTVFSPGALLVKVVYLFRDKSSGHDFELNIPEDPLTIRADDEKLIQIMENLLSNAIKYSPEGGTVRVGIEDLSKAAVPQSKIRITVADEGIGMTPEQIERIFDKFWRADASNKAIEGTGLGMSIVKYIAEAHGGTVKVESEGLGKGMTVTLEIPMD